MRSVHVYLIALVAISLLLATGAFAMIFSKANEVSRQHAEAQTLETAKALSRAVDRELERGVGILAALRASEAAAKRDWAALDRQARATVGSRHRWIVVQDRQGRQLVNTRLPVGARLPSAPAPQEMWREIGGGRARICNLVHGIIEREIVCVDSPLGAARPPEFAISMIFDPEVFRPVIRRESSDRGHIATLVDRTGIVIWRNNNPERFVGQRATGSMLAAVLSGQQSGIRETVSLEGVEMLSAFDRSALSGWSVIVGIPLEQVDSAARETLWSGSLFAIAVFALSALLAGLLARRLARGVDALGGAVQAAADGQPVARSGIAEFDAAASALEAASAARIRSDRRQQILVGELNHRVKNTLSIVQSLAHQTFRGRGSPEQAIATFEGRLSALAGAHNLLTREHWESASMFEIVRTALAPFCSESRCRLEGPDLTLSPQAAVSLSLALHELGTNASKYGALSKEGGHVSVRWSASGDEFELEWVERGGPPVEEPRQEGFGMRLIKRILAAELGRIDIRFDREGLSCSVRGPLPHHRNRFELDSAASSAA